MGNPNDLDRAASFWEDKIYRRFMTDEMNEDEFVKRLHVAFEQEERLHPGSTDKIYSGKDYDLIYLVVEEYESALKSAKSKNVPTDEPSLTINDTVIISDNNQIEDGLPEDDFLPVIEEEIPFIDPEDEERSLKEQERKEKLKKERKKQENYRLENEKRDQEYLAEQQRFNENLRYYEQNYQNFENTPYTAEDYINNYYSGENAYYQDIYTQEYQNTGNVGTDDFIRPQDATNPYEYASEIQRKKETQYDDKMNEIKAEKSAETKSRTEETYNSYKEKENERLNYESINQEGHFSFDESTVINSSQQAEQNNTEEQRKRERENFVDHKYDTPKPNDPHRHEEEYRREHSGNKQERSNNPPFPPFPPFPNDNGNGSENRSSNNHSPNDTTELTHSKGAKPFQVDRQGQGVTEKFQTFRENAYRTSAILSQTGVTGFVSKTANQIKSHASSELQSGDDTKDAMEAKQKVSTTTGVVYHGTSFAASRFLIYSDKQHTINSITKNLTSTTSGIKTSRMYDIEPEQRKGVSKSLRSAKKRQAFEKDLGTLGINDRKLKARIHELNKLKKKGVITNAEADELLRFKSAKKFRDFNKKKQSLSFHRRFLLSTVSSATRHTAAVSGNVGLYGASSVIQVASNPFLHKGLKKFYQATRFAAKATGKGIAKTGKFLAKNTKTGANIARAGRTIKAPVVGVRRGISSMTTSKIHALRASKVGIKTISKIKTLKKLSSATHSVVNAVTFLPRTLIGGAIKGVSWVMRTALLSVVGFILFLFILMAVIQAAGSMFSFIFGDSDGGLIDLSPYVEVINEKSEEYTARIQNLKNSSATNGTPFENVYLNLSSKDNTKEILSMMAVRFKNDLTLYHTENEIKQDKCNNYTNIRNTYCRCDGHRDDAIAYIKTLYDASHQLSITETKPYDCGKTETCNRRVEKKVEKTKWVSFSNMTEKEINNLDKSKYKSIAYDNKTNKPTGGYLIYYETVYECPKTHIDATIYSSILGFDEIFLVDGGGGNYGTAGAAPLANGESITIPSGLGNVHTYMGWHTITAKSSKQYQLRTDAGENYDPMGFAMIGDRYVIACTTTFGQVGDYVDFYQQDGSVLKCIIGDIKNQNDAGCNKWGHMNGKVIIEFVVNGNSWYANGSGNHVNPGTATCHPEWNQTLTKCVNRGNYWRNDSADAKDDNNEKTESSDSSKKDESTLTELQKKIAYNASNNIGTYPCTKDYCAAWVAGIYEASGCGRPYGDARDYWFQWKASGSSSPDNIPVGAVVVGSGQGSAGKIYGHVGIYIGNNMVAENIGRLNIVPLDTWIASNKQYNSSLGKTGFVGWVWPFNKSLGTGTDGSFGTEGYTGFGFWDDNNIKWAKNIYDQDWSELYKGFEKEDSKLDWASGNGKEISQHEYDQMMFLMDDLLGKPYVWGAEGPNEFDCSGFVMYVYQEAGIFDWNGNRPDVSSLAKQCIPISKSEARAGDLVIWGDDHVAIYAGLDRVYHASMSAKGVVNSKLWGEPKFYRIPKQ